MTVNKLKELVINCSVSTDSQKEDFRGYFILFVMKNFLFPTSGKTTTKAHIPAIIDVRNPNRYNWSRHILNYIKDGIGKFQEKNTEHIDGCMFVLMILYFHSNKHGPIKKCIGKDEPWTKEWTATELKRVSKEEADQLSGLIRKIQEWRKSEREKSSKNDTPNRAPYKRRRVQVKSQTGAQKKNSSNKKVVHADERESSSDSHTSDADWCHQEQQSPPSRANISANFPRVGAPSNNKVHQERQV
ncbi:hypothetical protein PIB30_042858 [Stylosanthes scabra]|uniref:Uncharacterized protein n=1 Tax=Stylosanthes scabra TaxID=79078 RepID=A0ABU6YE61_9FABA|nr:hypothetical protein [Stylosanthes scabra]